MKKLKKQMFSLYALGTALLTGGCASRTVYVCPSQPVCPPRPIIYSVPETRIEEYYFFNEETLTIETRKKKKPYESIHLWREYEY